MSAVLLTSIPVPADCSVLHRKRQTNFVHGEAYVELQTLFFARTISDIIGRFLPHQCLGLTTKAGLNIMTVSKLALTPFAFW